jgi:hypothetical protein
VISWHKVNNIHAQANARSGFAVDIQWRDGKLVQTTVHSPAGGHARLRYSSVTYDVKLANDEAFKSNGQ